MSRDALPPERINSIHRTRRLLEFWLVRGLMVVFVLVWATIVGTGLLAVLGNLKLH
jgi:hypothetical protein